VRGPKQEVDLYVADPAQLKLIKVGDQIEAEYTQRSPSPWSGEEVATVRRVLTHGPFRVSFHRLARPARDAPGRPHFFTAGR
jgi:hypothetical protein